MQIQKAFSSKCSKITLASDYFKSSYLCSLFAHIILNTTIYVIGVAGRRGWLCGCSGGGGAGCVGVAGEEGLVVWV